jgi:serine/threonine-protein kinase
MPERRTGFLLLACPNCHAGYKIRRDTADTEVTCRSCGHRWTPAQASRARQGAEARPDAPGPYAEPETPVAAPAAAPGSSRGELTPREDVSDALVGTNLNGFRILGRIGSGGFGVVYRAFDEALERQVAVKLLPADLSKKRPGLVERFLREARSAAKLSHPNIVTIHQIVPYEGTFYIVMELVDGGALHEFLAVQKRFKPAEATRVIRAAAEGLGHAHTRGVIHRDVKPGNIMMTNEGHVKVSDFGLARDVLQSKDIVGPGHSLGTPKYMSPEQALGEEPTAASDLYSLAATYYVLLTGRPPFEGSSERQVMKMHVQAEVPDPRTYVPKLPAGLYRFLQTAMAKKAEERYMKAEDFVEALDRIDFGASDDTSGSTAEALSAQIGRMSAVDRGSHLSATLGRAVKRSRRPRTSPSPQRVSSLDRSRRSFFSGWRLWAFVGVAVAAVLGAAVALAIFLASRHLERAEQEEAGGQGTEAAAVGPTEPAPAPPAPAPQPPETPSEAPPENAEAAEESAAPPEPEPPETAAEAPETTEPEPAEPPEPPPETVFKTNAQQMLEETIAYERNPDVWLPGVISAYENIISTYPGTKAANEARAALQRIERGERLPPDGGTPDEGGTEEGGANEAGD